MTRRREICRPHANVPARWVPGAIRTVDFLLSHFGRVGEFGAVKTHVGVVVTFIVARIILLRPANPNASWPFLSQPSTPRFLVEHPGVVVRDEPTTECTDRSDPLPCLRSGADARRMCYWPPRPACTGQRYPGRTQPRPLCAKPLILLHGPVAQGIEQQPSKLKVPGSNPGGVANKVNNLSQLSQNEKNARLTNG